MPTSEPRDLLIECGGCGIENLFSGFTPDQVAVCNQCRERQIWPNFNETHHEYRCRECGISICLLQATVFDEGNTPCRCGSLNVYRVPDSTLAETVRAAGGMDLDDPPDAPDPGYDWYRSEPGQGPTDYNELFDQNPGHN